MQKNLSPAHNSEKPCNGLPKNKSLRLYSHHSDPVHSSTKIFTEDTPQAAGGLRSLLKMQPDCDFHRVYIWMTAMTKTL